MAARDLLAGFTAFDEDVDGIRVHGRIGGSGPPVLLLHGYPQTHVMWHRVAPDLAREHTVVLADLRGYGDSAKPPAGTEAEEYCKRTMAADQVGLMARLGWTRFDAVGHDRGARVVHRMCLDFPDAVRRAAVLDIVPTRHAFDTADAAFGLAYEHWFFLAQDDGLPEHLIGAHPDHYLRTKLAKWSAPSSASPSFDEAALEQYLEHFRDHRTIAATCADYRAAAGIDRQHDEEDFRAGRRVRCPLLVLWGAQGFVGRRYDVLDVWRSYATDVRGTAVPRGHFLPEEAPGETGAELLRFLAEEA